MRQRPPHFHRDAYLDLIKRSVSNHLYLGGEDGFDDFCSIRYYDVASGSWKIDPLARPMTLLRKGQLDFVENVLLTVEREKVPGDVIEAGIWRGGVVIFLRALIKAYDIQDRRILAADSFSGIPISDSDAGDPVDRWPDRWVASRAEVQANLSRFGLLDEVIEFVTGPFAETLPKLRRKPFAVVRLDSDSHDSVLTSLEYLYPLLSKGGFLLVDDWHLLGCRKAVIKYRSRHAVAGAVRLCDGGAYWVKQEDYGFPGRP